MFVGVQRLVIQIPGARSLKDRRQVVRSFKDRVQARLHISVAEVGDVEHPGHATIAIAVVSNEAAVCDEVLAKVAAMASTLPNAVLADRATEVVSFGHGGAGVRGGIEYLKLSSDDRDVSCGEHDDGQDQEFDDEEDDHGTR
ncbi:MAG: DUF503 domain-containing protein [Polyangiaceae bacterium]|jgi:hypothetical protein|nr:DUF503 domain-containing protein [Polyangiaceae bacterium]